MTRRGVIWSGLALAALVVVVGLGAYYVNGAQTPEPTPTPPSTSSSAAGGVESVATEALVTDTVVSEAAAAGQGVLTPSAEIPNSPANPDAAGVAASAPSLAQPQGGDLVQAVAFDAESFNPVLDNNATALAVAEKIYPRLAGQDPQSGAITPTELAESWTISPDGRVYTFTLRSNITWSDGQPVSAADFLYTYGALASEAAQSPFRGRTTNIERIEAPDATTLVVTLRQPDCAILHNLRQPLLPAHRFAPDYSDLRTNPLNTAPSISAGPFAFVERSPGAQIVLARNPAYWKGPARMDHWLLRVIPDAAARWAALQRGEVDLVQLSAADLTQVGSSSGPNVEMYLYPETGYHFIALNLADPANPQPGQDAAGATIAQAPHPILGDENVRRALALAIDYFQVIDRAFGGQAYPLAGYVLPSVSWAFAEDLAPLATDTAQAQALLDAAGWVDSDGDGVRDRNGQPLELTLITNADNAQRVAAGELVRDQLGGLGVRINFTPLPFDELAAALLGQRYDMALAGWDNVSSDPGMSTFWHSRDDVPDAGFNLASYQDAEMDGWLDQARQLAGCGLAPRGELYRQAQHRLYERVPYIWLGGELAAWAWDKQWRELAPGPWSLDYNANSWWRGQE